MSNNQQAANIIDFSSYRALRKVRTAEQNLGVPTPGAWMFATVPVMIPAVAWLPVWYMAQFEPPPDPPNE